jgi:hypothetical protein
LLVLLLLVVAIPGCGGCRKDKPKAKKDEQPKPTFAIGVFTTLPGEFDQQWGGIKPGHWTNARIQMTSNKEDFHGQLATTPFALPDSPFLLESKRKIVLPKEQAKQPELTFFVPAGQRKSQLATQLQTDSGGSVLSEGQPLTYLPAHQYYLMVLSSNNVQSYSYLRTMDTIRAPREGTGGGPQYSAHYRVLLPEIKNRVPLPEGSLTWTALAYLFWDDFDPTLLTPDQQSALLDWIHWGGQLIISGPRSWDSLRGSFLDPVLPAEGDGVLEISQEMLAELNARWSHEIRPLQLVAPWSGVKLVVREDPRVQTLVASGTRPLVVERRVGRGRVLISAFSLSQRELLNWDGYDSMLNCCLLRRPERSFSHAGGTLDVGWADGMKMDNAERATGVRYFSRDAGTEDALDSWHTAGIRSASKLPGETYEDPNQWSAGGMIPLEQYDPNLPSRFVGPGVGGWNDFSLSSDAARAVLGEASGIRIPNRYFVLRIMLIYLIVLVPLNWGVFRLLGRVEWAWIAAPLISLGFAVAVVRLAQLDIGFSRAETQVAVVETFAGYPRAHVTRYASLYTSLSTRYDVELDELSALALPFPQQLESNSASSTMTATFRQEDKIRLTGLDVGSNSIGMLHSEEIHDLGGDIHLESSGSTKMIVNHSTLTLQDAVVISPEGIASIGELKAGESKPLVLRRSDELPKKISSAFSDGERVDLGPFIELAMATSEEGEWRLIGWSNEKIPGMSIEPRASQSKSISMVVCHLSFEPLPDPVRESSSRAALEKAGVLVVEETEIQ